MGKRDNTVAAVHLCFLRDGIRQIVTFGIQAGAVHHPYTPLSFFVSLPRREKSSSRF